MSPDDRDDARAPTPAWTAWALLVVVLVAFFAPLLFRGHVVHAHDNALEVGLEPDPRSPWRSTHLFQDQSTMFVPELAEHRGGERDGWISTWFPRAGLGRPTWHHFGVGNAFLVDRVLATFIEDPYRAYTALAVLALVAAAVATFLFLRARALDPLAALAGALALSAGTFHAGWPTFLMLNWGFAGTFSALWLVELLVVRATAVRFVALVLVLHLLLLAAYPQQVAFHAWIAGAYALLRLGTADRARGRRLRLALGLAGAAVAAVLSVAPVYADVLLDLRRSIRDGLGAEYVVEGLPRLESLLDLRVFLVQVVDGSWLGDPLSDDFPRALSVMPAHTLTPAYAGLVLLAFGSGRRRRLWFWGGTVAVALAMTVSAPLYRFAAEHLGTSFSRLTPFVAALPGLAVLSALGADAIVRRKPSTARLARATLALLPVALALAAVAPGDVPVDAAAVAGGIAYAVALAVAAATGSRIVLAAILVSIPFVHGTRLFVHRPRADVKTTSPLVESVRGQLPEGTRFAWVGPRPPALLSSNQEAVLGLSSIHTHDAFAGRAFARFAERLCPAQKMASGGEGAPRTYDRRFPRVGHESRLDDEVLATSAIGLLLSSRPLVGRGIVPLDVVDGVHLSRPRLVGPTEAVATEFTRIGPGEVRVEPSALVSAAARDAVRRGGSVADRLSFTLSPPAPDDRPRLLFVSQAHHPHWEARGGGVDLETVRVNDLYQGVVVPAGVERIELAFRPWVRHAWIPQAVLCLALLGSSLLRLRSRAG